MPGPKPQEPQQISVAVSDALKSTPRGRTFDASDSAEEHMASMEVRNAIAKCGMEKRHLTRQVRREGPWFQTLEKIRPKVGTGYLIALLGIRGTGKTQMAAELVKCSCQPRPDEHVPTKLNVVPARYMLAIEFFLSLRQTYDKTGDSELDILNRLVRQFGLVIIDEVQERGNTDFEDRMLTLLIDRRYAAMGDTLLLSNLTPEQFALAVGPSIASRLNEAGGIIECDWPSFRTGPTT